LVNEAWLLQLMEELPTSNIASDIARYLGIALPESQVAEAVLES